MGRVFGNSKLKTQNLVLKAAETSQCIIWYLFTSKDVNTPVWGLKRVYEDV